MVRMILHEAKGPLELKPSEKSVWICRCGLSKNQPFCDGSHKKTLDEKDGKTCRYNPDGTRSETRL